jgi:DNA primase small subunit
MSDIAYLRRLFKSYYKEKRSEIPAINSINQREFGYIPWDQKVIMKRHMSFESKESITKHLINIGPRHVYSSGALYTQPENQDMEGKVYHGCDFIIDIDVDHFYTPCKEDHDIRYCKECGTSGKGMNRKCPNCNKLKIKTLTWICEDCLKIAKKEIITLIYDFLIPDFGINLDEVKIVFSGHRGYHLKIENDQIRILTSDDRREIADYITGENISLEILGLQEKGGIIYRFSEDTIGWTKKIIKKAIEIMEKPNLEIQDLLSNKELFNFTNHYIKSLLASKQMFLNKIKNNKEYSLPSIEGFALTNWKKFFTGVIGEVGVEIDTPVAVDIHRLIRYPGSLHGKTGFKAQEILPDEFDNFNPLDEKNEKLDPVVFESKVQTIQKLEILEPKVPETNIKGVKYGPYNKGEIIDVPHHIAVFLLCKEVAKTI